MEKTLAERFGNIDWLILDVDGVLTPGSITYPADGTLSLEQKSFHVRDGSALKIWHDVGKFSAIITGRRSPMVERRAQELGVTHVVQGSDSKGDALARFQTDFDVDAEQIGYVGDDLADLPVLRQAGLAVTVADGCSDVMSMAHYVTQASGGLGAVREIIERILRCQGLWPEQAGVPART